MKNMEHIRDLFPILQLDHGKLVYLDSAASAQKPKEVIDAMDIFTTTSYANVHRGIYDLSQRSTTEFEKAREKIAAFLRVPNAKEIVFTRSLTEGINLLAQSFVKPQLKSGDQVLISAMEHHSNIVPWQMICQETGAELKFVPVLENGELDLKEFSSMLNANVKVVSITHISNVLGTINPIQKIVKLAHEKNIPVIVDGAQAAPHISVNVKELDCDFYLFTGHKLYGPTGTGVIYGKWNLWLGMKPYHGGGEMVEEVTMESSTYKLPPARFEAGTPNIIGAVGLGYAVDFMESIGFDQIVKHEQELLQYALQKLQAIPGIKIYGEAKDRIGLISFLIDGFHPHDIAAILDQESIAVRVGHHCAQPLHKQFGIQGTIRVCFGMYNTKKDIDRLIDGIQKAKSLLE